MQLSIAQTKVVIPRRRSDLITRTRLLHLLYDLIDYRLILAVAPAGYGKTSLFIDFAHETEMAICWYSVDEADGEFSRFFTYFVAALTRRFPQLKNGLLANPHPLLSSSHTVDQLVTMVVNELYSSVNEHFLIVIDDYHFVDGVTDIDRFISQFIQLADDNCHVALLSRKLLTLSDLPLMIARSYVAGLSFEELRFQKSEISNLMVHNYNLALSEQELDNLYQSTEGWITGLLLSSIYEDRKIGNWARLSRASGIDLYSYLAQQILNQQPPLLRQFLLYTSFLGEFNVALCTDVLTDLMAAHTKWGQLFDTVVQNNLFVLNLGEREPWLRYHHLFQDFLQQTLRDEHPETVLAIQHRLAKHYATQGNWEKAFEIYQIIQDSQALIQLVKEAGVSLIGSGRYALLAQWLEVLPPRALHSDPQLLSLHGTAQVSLGNVEAGLLSLNRAATAFKQSPHKDGLVRTLIRRASAHYQLGNYQSVLQDVDDALALLPVAVAVTAGAGLASPPPMGEITALHAEALRLRGLCDYVKGSFVYAIDHLAAAEHLYTQLDDVHNSTRLTLEIATAHMGMGRYQEAADHFEQVAERWRSLHNLLGMANVLNNLGVLCHLRGNYQEALAHFIEALECARRCGYRRIEAYTLASIGDLFADLRMAQIADEFYEKAYPIAKSINERFLLLHLNISLLLMSLPQNRHQDAVMFLDAAGRLLAAETSPFEHGLFRMAVGQYHLLGGRNHEAIATLKEAVKCLGETDQRVEFARAHLFLAAAQHDVGDGKNALESVTQMLKIAQELDYWHPLVTAGHTVSDFLETIQIDNDYRGGIERLRQQVRDFNQISPDLRRQLRQAITPLLETPAAYQSSLYIRMLGRSEVLRNGTLIDNSEWQTQSARDLFSVLWHTPRV